ncbi:MAG: hypothetical protein DSY70_01945 [Desulfobulbus sp.]|nr:MAG: hypothetical protein DSY70_01945 [Desulfobulbus sp.]
MTWDSPRFPVVECTLTEAQTAVLKCISPLAGEKVPVSEALFYQNSTPLLAALPKPPFDQSIRDGFALSKTPHVVNDGRATFQVIGEIAAGCTNPGKLQPGEAVSIMTGAMVPPGCVQVVPFEVCLEEDESVSMSLENLQNKQTFIQTKGSEVKEGKVLVNAGVCLLPEHLLMLAENGCREITVSRKPDVAVICTGSELVGTGTMPGAGQKISGNGVFLPGLIQAENAGCSWSVTVADEVELIVKSINSTLARKPDMILSTGGMGPGKFDLMEQVFARLGGRVVYNRLCVRPGKFTLFGTVYDTPFFALPGPPPAVRLLFYELVAPALGALQGKSQVVAPLVTASLENTLSVKNTGHLSLKGAVVRLTDNRLRVRPAGRMEPINSIIYLQGERRTAEYGDNVQVRLLGGLQGLAM